MRHAGQVVTRTRRGFAFGRIAATSVIAAAMVLLVLVTPKLRRPAEPGLAWQAEERRA